ncbi:hypothetical protein KIN20_027352 [Parelaphostrongylus tenuis]|uniref:Uncharacterized protein n=1 Tax=Parelaphostrongylus tenuis TaxID=148309 RepID=A0AAD5QZG8_PARTN|nr:hypothetical protein KIN20_027352 [Parelaphostrongylus tenuis]
MMVCIGAGANPTPNEPLPDFVVKDPMKDLLNERRHLLANNWYSSVALAESPLQGITHFIGT